MKLYIQNVMQKMKVWRPTMTKCCATCDWYAEFEGVCVNYHSPHCADFRDADDGCRYWKGKEAGHEISQQKDGQDV